MKYGTIVKVKSGFYEGSYGWVVDQLNDVCYTVNLKLHKDESHVNFRDVNFNIDNLELQPHISRLD